MQNKLLSISIASYNTERFIDKAVTSLVVDKDHMERLEIIIVNDGSKDKTSELAHLFESKYPGSVIVIDKENGGYGSTINASLPVASGKYYKLLDGDDWFDKEALTAFLDFIDDCDADLIVSPYYEIRKADILIDNHKDIPSRPERVDDLQLDNMLFVMHELAIKTDLLRNLGKPIAEHCFYTDSEFVFYCLTAANTIVRFDRAIYRYRLGVEGQSVSLEGIRKHYKDLSVVAQRMMKADAEEKDFGEKTKRKLLDLCIKNITYHAYRAYMLLSHPGEHRNDLVDFDNKIRKAYSSAYVKGNEGRLVRICRKLHFRPYWAFCRLALWKYTNEQ